MKLIRREVEALINEKYGYDFLVKKKLMKELAEVKRTLKALKSKTMSLEKRKAELLILLGE